MTDKRILESKFKAKLRKELVERYPGCRVVNNDPVDNQGISDILVLYGPTWAMLEGKRSSDSEHRPNQEYYIREFSKDSFAATIHPENKEYILAALDEWFKFVHGFELKRNFYKRGNIDVME